MTWTSCTPLNLKTVWMAQTWSSNILATWVILKAYGDIWTVMLFHFGWKICFGKQYLLRLQRLKLHLVTASHMVWLCKIQISETYLWWNPLEDYNGLLLSVTDHELPLYITHKEGWSIKTTVAPTVEWASVLCKLWGGVLHEDTAPQMSWNYNFLQSSVWIPGHS